MTMTATPDEPRRPGRPSLLEYELQPDGSYTWPEKSAPALLLTAIKACAHKHIAARYAGISRTTFDNWLDRGRVARLRAVETGRQVARRDRPYVAFLDAVEEAEAFAEVRLVGLIVNEVKRKPEVGLRLLQNRWPSRWKPAEQIELGPTVTPRETEGPTEDPAELLRRKLDQIAERRARADAAVAGALDDVIDVDPDDPPPTSTAVVRQPRPGPRPSGGTVEP